MYQDICDELNLGNIISTKSIQSLWSDYGEIVRLTCEKKSVILKHIKLPKEFIHPKGWNTKISHERKLSSYKVEVKWYENFSNKRDLNCFVPKGLKTFYKDDEYLIVMEDLLALGFTETTKLATNNHLKSVISWLAYFHAKNMNKKVFDLWNIGTYWNLDTRPDEFEKLEDKKLKKYAKEIDIKLNEAKYKTIVHGDAKLANFCFSKDAKKCAAVDFQYVGVGSGIKDLIYFISSAVEVAKLKDEEFWILSYYFKKLKEAF